MFWIFYTFFHITCVFRNLALLNIPLEFKFLFLEMQKFLNLRFKFELLIFESCLKLIYDIYIYINL